MTRRATIKPSRVGGPTMLSLIETNLHTLQDGFESPSSTLGDTSLLTPQIASY